MEGPLTPPRKSKPQPRRPNEKNLVGGNFPARDGPPRRCEIPERRNPEPRKNKCATPTNSPVIGMGERGLPTASNATPASATSHGSKESSDIHPRIRALYVRLRHPRIRADHRRKKVSRQTTARLHTPLFEHSHARNCTPASTYSSTLALFLGDRFPADRNEVT